MPWRGWLAFEDVLVYSVKVLRLIGLILLIPFFIAWDLVLWFVKRNS